ncbi:MAG: hypothetical protein M3010_00445, partial [Candidatus Dormibacteraeota bacterium]|nr:hypothetical protein [Candidatus Dormibacteraeota bacterium]
MDLETPRSLGDSEDSEAERHAPGRVSPTKKPLEQFLAEFEARLGADPGQPATSASAALEGRAAGAWRTPVEGGDRQGRRPARSTPWRSPPDSPGLTTSAAPGTTATPPEVDGEAPVVEVSAPGVEGVASD